jgi:hypothetical protein
MKKNCLLLLLPLILIACNNNHKNADEKKEGKAKDSLAVLNSPVLGAYVGNLVIIK